MWETFHEEENEVRVSISSRIPPNITLKGCYTVDFIQFEQGYTGYVCPNLWFHGTGDRFKFLDSAVGEWQNDEVYWV